MKPKEFFNCLPREEIVKAIKAAESHTSGEIRVYVTHREVRDPVVAAREHFTALGMEKTKHRNGVLIFVAPRSRAFAVLGDSGIHAHCGQEYWEQLVRSIGDHFSRLQFGPGLLYAIKSTGDLLAKHFPPAGPNRNELPDDVAHD